jgi:hypothetical protein
MAGNIIRHRVEKSRPLWTKDTNRSVEEQGGKDLM